MRRELCQLFSLGPGAREDVATPLPSRKMFRSLSMREATRLRHRAQLGHRHSFMGPGAGAGLGKGARPDRRHVALPPHSGPVRGGGARGAVQH